MFILSAVTAFLKRAVAVATACLVFVAAGSKAQVSVSQMLVRGRAPHLLSVPSYSFYEPTVKIPKTGALEKKGSLTMYLAKNESEYCQIALQARLDREAARVSLSKFTNENGDTLETVFCEEYYVKTTGETIFGAYPDALIPLTVGSENKLPMGKMQNIPLYIGVKTTADTVPGDYTAKLTLLCNDSTEDKYERLDVEVAAHVWDFTLPEKPAMDTAMGLGKGDIARAHHVDPGSDEATELYKAYYEYLLEHKISAYNLPVDILSDEADAYMSDPRCTSFCVPYADDDTIRAYAAKLKSNPEWAAKAYFYPIDEPGNDEAYAQYDKICERLASLYPGYNMVTPFYTNKVEIGGETRLGIDLQDGRSSIMCPESPLFDEKGFKERARERQANGDKLWWYVCCGPVPKTAYCNRFTHQEGIKHRLLFWQQKQLNVTGLLYWSTSYWSDVGGDPWSSAWTTPWTGPDTFGDGSLLYDGYHVGKDGPVSSLRLEAVMNGIEDYEYLTMAQELLGDEFVDRIISSVVRDLTHYTKSDGRFAVIRVALGSAIEAAGR